MANSTKYKIGGMDCDSCAKMIELDLEDAGIKSCKCSYPNQSLVIEEDHNSEVVIETVKKSGYSINITTEE